MNVRIHHTSTREAVLKAEELANKVRQKKFTIPIRNQDGSLTTDLMYFRTVDANRVDDDIAQVSLVWDVQNQFI